MDCFDIWLKRCSSLPQHSSSLVYSFRCVCGLQCIRRTNQCLDLRIKQSVPTKIRQGNYFADWISNTYRSSIAEHLINNCNCASSYNVDLFTILSKSHSDYHLKVLETIHILTHKLSLCKQRKMFYWVWIWLLPDLPLPFLVNLHFFLPPPTIHSFWTQSMMGISVSI